MLILALAAVEIGLGTVFWFADLYMPGGRPDRRLSDRRSWDGAVPVPIPVDRSKRPRPTAGANRPPPRFSL